MSRKFCFSHEQLTAELYRQIGQLKVELDWLKKKSDISIETKRLLIDPNFLKIPIHRQCQLLGLGRSSYYYQPAGESAENLFYMRILDEQYTQTPFYGVPKMTAWLKSVGHCVNKKRVARLMGLRAIFPKPVSRAKGSRNTLIC